MVGLVLCRLYRYDGWWYVDRITSSQVLYPNDGEVSVMAIDSAIFSNYEIVTTLNTVSGA